MNKLIGIANLKPGGVFLWKAHPKQPRVPLELECLCCGQYLQVPRGAYSVPRESRQVLSRSIDKADAYLRSVQRLLHALRRASRHPGGKSSLGHD